MKPFIKPRPATSPAAPPPAPASPSVTPGELSISSLAAAIADPAERATYLDRACRGDEALRGRIEERLAAKAAPQFASPAVIQPQHLAPHTQHGQAVALVPMTAAQLANATAPAVKPNTIPWFAATLLAAVAGALAVLFSIEKANRAKAELAAVEAQGDTAEARQQRLEAEAAALESKTAAERATQQARQQRDAALSAAEKEKAAREAADTARAKAESLATDAATAREQAVQEKDTAAAAQKSANAALAGTLAALAGAQLDSRNYPGAVQSARQSLELRTALGVTGWPLIETHTLLGSALLQTSKDIDAEREILAAAAAIESLGTPADEDAKARFTAATKQILRFFSITGRRKAGSEWKAKFDALAKPPSHVADC